MKHRLSSIIHHSTLVFALLATLTAIPTVASAYDFSAVAPSGQRLYYNIVNSSEVAVTYPSNTSDYYHGYPMPTGNLTIPSTVTNESTTYSVTSIGNNAFHDCSGLTSVIIPNTVTYIESNAFFGCRNLSEVTIPNSVSSIGMGAFTSCAFSSMTIPNSVSSIGWGAFSGCSNLASVTIPNSVTDLGQGAFADCISLTSITIPNSITTIQYNTIKNCNGLTSVTIGNSVTEIQEGAFDGCDALAMTNYTGTIAGWCNIDFRGGITPPLLQNPIRFSYNFYINGVEVTDLIVPDGVTEIKDFAFFRCNSLTSATISNSVETIGQMAFAACRNMNSITIGYSVSSIGFRALSAFGLTSMTVASGNTHFDSRDNCNAVIQTDNNTLIAGCRTTVIPNTVTTIGEYAFAGYSDLTTITIPNAITAIGDYAFGSTGLTEIITHATIPPTLGNDVFSNVPTDIPIYVPCGSLAAYQAADGWSNFTNIQASGPYPYALTVSAADNTMGSADVTTNPSCADNSATITATSNCGFRFVRWEDAAGATVSTENPFTLAVTHDTALTAVFETSDATRISLVCPSGQTLLSPRLHQPHRHGGAGERPLPLLHHLSHRSTDHSLQHHREWTYIFCDQHRTQCFRGML